MHSEFYGKSKNSLVQFAEPSTQQQHGRLANDDGGTANAKNELMKGSNWDIYRKMLYLCTVVYQDERTVAYKQWMCEKGRVWDGDRYIDSKSQKELLPAKGCIDHNDVLDGKELPPSLSFSLLLLHSSSHCSIEQQCFAMEFHLFDVHFRKVKHQYIDSAAATSAVAGGNAVRCISMASHWRPFRQNTKHQNNSIEFVLLSCSRDGVNCIYVFVCYCLQCTPGWFVKKVTKINIFNAFVLPTGLSYQAGSGNFSPETSGMPLHNSNWSKKNQATSACSV